MYVLTDFKLCTFLSFAADVVEKSCFIFTESLVSNVIEAGPSIFQSLGVPLFEVLTIIQLQEAVTAMCFAKMLFWKFQAKAFKNTRDFVHFLKSSRLLGGY